MIRHPVRFAVQAAHPRRFLLPVRPHVLIMIIPIPPRPHLLLPPLSPLPTHPQDLLILQIPLFPTTTSHHAPPPQPRRPSRPTQRRAIRPLAPQNRRLVLLPVALAEPEAAVLGPEEKPDAAEDEADADEREEGEEAAVVDVVGVDGAGAGVVLCAWEAGGGAGGEVVGGGLEGGGGRDGWRHIGKGITRSTSCFYRIRREITCFLSRQSSRH